MKDVHHAPIWKKLQKDLPIYGEPNGRCHKRVGLILSADGASMSTFQAADFSLTPIILSILNWPVGLRTKALRMLVTGITPKNNKQTSLYLGKPILPLLLFQINSVQTLIDNHCSFFVFIQNH